MPYNPLTQTLAFGQTTSTQRFQSTSQFFNTVTERSSHYRIQVQTTTLNSDRDVVQFGIYFAAPTNDLRNYSYLSS